MRPGILYKLKCKFMEECREDKEVGTYVGESARTAYDRGQSKLKIMIETNKTQGLQLRTVSENN